MAGSRSRARTLACLALLFALLLVGSFSRSARAGTSTRSVVLVETGAEIATEADYLSGRKLTVVCAASGAEWARALSAAGLSAGQADEYYGFSLITEGVMHLSPYVCEGLRLGMTSSSRQTHELQVAWAVDVLVHESTHMARFSYDEALVEACARIGLPGELHRLYGIAYRSAEMSRLTSDAALFRSTQSPAYQGGSCPTLSP
jgi:hypothetical protein